MWWVCQSVCLFDSPLMHITRKPHGRSHRIFMLVTCGRGCLGPPLTASAICYVLPVLWITLHFYYFYSMRPMGQNQARRYISTKFARWQHQLDVRQLMFGGVHRNFFAAQGTKSALYNFLFAYIAGRPIFVVVTRHCVIMTNKSQFVSSIICIRLERKLFLR